MCLSDPATERFPARVEADGAEGPRGGNVKLRLTDPQASVFISRFGDGQQPLRGVDPKATAGNGGPGGLATATGGDRAMLRDRELFVPFSEFPWFKESTVDQILDVEWPSPHHLYWPELDIDLAVDSIEHPDRYPLVSRSSPDKRMERSA